MTHADRINPFSAPQSLAPIGSPSSKQHALTLDPPIEFDAYPSLEEALEIVPLVIRKAPSTLKVSVYRVVLLLAAMSMSWVLWTRPTIVFGVFLFFMIVVVILDLGIGPFVRWRLVSTFKKSGYSERRVQGRFSSEGVESNSVIDGTNEFFAWHEYLEVRLNDYGAVLIRRQPSNRRRKHVGFVTRSLFATEADWLRLRDYLSRRFDLLP